MAAPVVAALLSCELNKTTTTDALANLKAKAIDLGEPGRDDIFGHGLLH
jgi:minor extracellular protease Epr